jgi:5'-3' exonuclease
VPPSAIADYLALVGDSADGIPGVPRWGAKSAATLLARYGSLEAIPDDERSWDVSVRGAQALAESLRQKRSDAGLYKRLATLRRDVPLGESLDQLRYRGAPRARLEALCARLEDPRLLERVAAVVD